MLCFAFPSINVLHIWTPRRPAVRDRALLRRRKQLNTSRSFRLPRYPLTMTRKKGAFFPGTIVGVRFGGRVTTAFVVEDRGVFRGRRILSVHLGD